MKPISSIGTIGEYVQSFSLGLAAKVASQCAPLHDPEKQGHHPVIQKLATKPFARQADLITACVKSLTKNKLAILACRMGTGKTLGSIATVHCHANGKPYTALVMCPSHLTKKWVSEVHKFLGGKVQATVINDWKQFMFLSCLPKPTVPTWYIIAQTAAKLGYSKRCAAIRKVKKVMTDLGLHPTQCNVCPACDYPVYHRGILATTEDIERVHPKCQGMKCKACNKSWHHDMKECPGCSSILRKCGEPLWQAEGHKVAPSTYAKVKNIRKFTYFVRDEAHGSKSADSIDGHACATFAALAKYTVLLTGTLLAGKSEDLRPLLFRLKPRNFINMGYGWNSEIDFATRYGRIQTVVRTSSGGNYEKRKRGKGSSKSTSRDVKPGIMPHLFPDFVANCTVFLSLTDLVTNLPAYHEETVSVTMEPAVFAVYKDMQDKLLAAFRDLYVNNRRLACKMLGPMLETLMTWPDVPYGRKPVCITDDLGHTHTILIPPALDRSTVYPKEQRLLDLIASEKKQGRQCFVYSDRDDTRERLVNIMESRGLKVAHLTVAVKPDMRLEWLAANAPGCDLGICNPTLIETGCELFGPKFNFATLIWYSTGWRLNTLRQASMRSWRIGQKLDCKTMYLYYAMTAQEKAIGIMASKLVAAEAIEGKFSDQGLANEAIDEDIAMEIARSLADNIEVNIQKRYNPISQGVNQSDRIELMRRRLAAYKAQLATVS